MIINHNMNAMNAHRQMGMNTVNSGKSMEKLSSGLRINRAGDDAAGLAISEKMRGQIRGLDQASRNAQDGISMLQTGEGALNETHSILQRMRELANQAGNDTNTPQDRDEIQKEMNQLTSEINRVGNTTEFNTQSLLKGDENLKVTVTNTVNGVTGKAVVNAVAGEYAISGELKAEEIVIDGKKLTLVGDTQDKLYKDLKDKIEADTGTDGLATKYTVGTYTAGDNKLTLTQKTGTETSTKLTSTQGKVTETTAGVKGEAVVTAVLGKDTISGELKAGEITIDGKKLTISGSDQDALYTSLKNAIEANTDLNKKYTVGVYTNKDNKLSLTQKSGNESSQSVDASIPSVKSFTMQVGANENQTMTLEFEDMRAKSLGLTGIGDKYTNGKTVTDGTDNNNVENALDVSNSKNAGNAVTTIQSAIDKVSGERSKLGAYQNRLEHTINNLGTSSENLSAAESRVRDVDMAKEMMNFGKNNILAQAAQAMLAQANQQPQGVLQLLR